jgi:hypothetical protein
MTPPQHYFANPDYQRLEAVFHDYVAQGSGRNITWLAAKTGLPLAVIGKGMVEGFWIQRIHAISKDAAAETRNRAAAAQGKLVGDVAGMNERDVARFMELEEEAHIQLLARLRGGAASTSTMKDDSLIKLFFTAVEKRRKALGLEEGAPPTNPLQRLLEGSIVADNTPPAQPFQLDPAKLEAPKELPAMPGMTSDSVEDPKRDLDDDEKELLRGND